MSEIKAVLPPSGRDLRLDFFRGFANWVIFVDHIPNNVVNWLTSRNYGFSDAADLFVFISGYTAAFVYARIMLERGFVVGATKLLKRVWQLYVAHVLLFIVYIVGIGYVAQRWNLPIVIHEFNVAGILDNPDTDPARRPAVEVQALQSRRAAALHHPDGGVSVRAVVHAAQTGPDDACIDCALLRCPPIRLEFSVVSHRQLVFQSVLLADPVHVRRLVRTWRSFRRQAHHPVARADRRRRSLSGVRRRHDACRQIPFVRRASSPSGSIRCSIRTTRRTWPPIA